MFLSAWIVWLSLPLSTVPLGPTPSSQEMRRFEQNCKENIHVTCMRDGVRWLQTARLTLEQRRSILARVASAYLGLGRPNDAKRAMRKAVHLAPCRALPKGLSSQTQTFYRAARSRLFKKDISPPILSAIPPHVSTFRRKGVLLVKATDDLKVRGVRLFFRTHKTGTFRRLVFRNVGKDRYRVTVPQKVLVSAKVFEYYIEARDCANRIATNQANASQPIQLSFEEKSSSAKAVGAGVLMAVGGTLIVASSLAFLNTSLDMERWKASQDLAESEKIRERIIVFQSLGWGGIGLGLVAVGVGTYLLLSPSSSKKPSPTRVSVHPVPSMQKAPGSFVHVLFEELDL